MTLLFIEGFETYNNITSSVSSALNKKWDTAVGTLTLNTGGRLNTGGKYLSLGYQSPPSSLVGKLSDYDAIGRTTIIVNCALKFSSTPASVYNNTIYPFLYGTNADTSVTSALLYPTSTGSPTSWMVGNQSLTLTGFTFGSWHYLEAKFVYSTGTTWTATIKLDGTQVFNSTTDLGLNNLDQISFGSPVSSGSVTVDLDDIAICDGLGSINNDFITNATQYTVEAITPNAAGNYSQWTSSSGTHYLDVQSDNGDASYIRTTASSMDSFGLSNLGYVNGNIAGIQITTRSRSILGDPGIGITHFTRISATNYPADTFYNVTNSYNKGQNSILELNPNTSASWTSSELNALEVGVQYVYNSGAFTPLDIPDIRTWLGSGPNFFYSDTGLTTPITVDGDSIVAIKDGARPTEYFYNGSGYAKDTGVDNIWYCENLGGIFVDVSGASGLTSITELTMFWAGIWRNSNVNIRGQILSIYQNGSGGNYLMLESNTFDTAGGYWGLYYGSGSTDTNKVIVEDQPVVIICRFNSLSGTISSQVDYYLNGGTKAVFNNKSGPGNFSLLDVPSLNSVSYLGTLNVPPVDSYSSGIYTRAITDTEINNLGNYLADLVGATWTNI